MAARISFLLLFVIFTPIKGFSSNYEVSTYKSYASTNALHYYRVFTSTILDLHRPNNIFVCMIVCTKLNECRSFYLESGACVFGVTQIVNGIENTDLTTVKANQKIYIKGDSFMLFVLTILCNFYELF